MAFVPSEHSYGGWLDDAEAAVKSRYQSAVSTVTSARDQLVNTVTAPVRQAEAAATKAQQAVSDVRATTEAARDTAITAAKVVPWVIGGVVALGGLYVYSQGHRRNPLDGHTVARWLLLGGTVAGGAGVALTSAGAATLQPEVLALSGPLMVLGMVMVGASGAAEKFHETGRKDAA